MELSAGGQLAVEQVSAVEFDAVEFNLADVIIPAACSLPAEVRQFQA